MCTGTAKSLPIYSEEQVFAYSSCFGNKLHVRLKWAGLYQLSGVMNMWKKYHLCVEISAGWKLHCLFYDSKLKIALWKSLESLESHAYYVDVRGI